MFRVFNPVLLLLILAGSALAENRVQPPSRKFLFNEDSKDFRKQRKKTVKEVISSEAPASQDLDVKAPQVEFEKGTNRVKASGGVALALSGTRVQAESATVNTQTKDADLAGKVVINSPSASIASDTGSMNMNSELGSFSCSEIDLADSNYQIGAQQIEKTGEESFRLKDAELSGCKCKEPGKGNCSAVDQNRPWAIHSDEVHITRDGYAHAYNAWLDFHGVPLFYSPYLGFPVKEERQSGLLAPQFGYNDEDGFLAKIPLFVTLGESADVTFTPFTETRTRTGLSFDYRQAFSRYNQVTSRITYSDESARGDDLRGTNIDGLSDPTFDENRLGGFYKQIWRSAPDSEVPFSFVVDGHYVSDDLFLREIEDDDIGDPSDRQVVSTALARTNLGEYGTAELLGEWVQATDEKDDDLVLKRLPEGRIDLVKSFRPFGSNPYGLKLVSKVSYLGDEFYRKEGYDGYRSHVSPSIAVPFHIQNYTQGSLTFTYQRTDYSLDDRKNPSTGTELDSSYGRNVPSFVYQMGTGAERVFAVDDDSWITSLTSLGSKNQENRLVRLKNTIEPTFKYSYIPDVNQDDNPFYDSLDRIRERQLLSYGVRSSLFGRFLPPNASKEAIAETIPDIEDLPSISGENTALSDLGDIEDLGSFGGDVAIRSGEVRELVRVTVKQTFDTIEDKENRVDNRNGFSNVDGQILLYPTPSFGLGFESSYNAEDGVFDYWAISNHIFDDRGDALRARWTHNRDSTTGEDVVSQIEASAEMKVVERLRFGLYSRFDELNGDSIESRAAFRVTSSCNCWHVDFGLGEKDNPDKRFALLSFTFTGLGDISQNVRYGERSAQ